MCLCRSHCLLTYIVLCSYVYITYTHLDHINGLVLSMCMLKGLCKHSHAAQHVIDNIKTMFADCDQPKFASWSTNNKD